MLYILYKHDTIFRVSTICASKYYIASHIVNTSAYTYILRYTTFNLLWHVSFWNSNVHYVHLYDINTIVQTVVDIVVMRICILLTFVQQGVYLDMDGLV